MPSDSDRTRAEQAAGETSTCEGVLLRLPAASRQGEAKGPGEQETPEKGDKSKNGKEVMVVVMYTLRRDPDGKLHGPINKKIWATFGGRKAAALWAREEATSAALVRTRPRRYRLCWMVPRG